MEYYNTDIRMLKKNLRMYKYKINKNAQVIYICFYRSWVTPFSDTTTFKEYSSTK